MTGPGLTRRQRSARWAGVAVLVAIAGYVVWGSRVSQDHAAAQDRAITALSAQIEAYRAQAAQHGLPTGPPPVAIVQGATGPAGPGPTDAQVAAAVVAYLIAHPPAADASQGQVTDAVSVYLAAHPPAPGPPPSDAQVASAVAAYMAAHPAPSGPPGEQGTQGDPGPAGPVGPAGAPGPDPAGWTWTDPQGVTYDCAQDGQQPSPHYTCTPRSSPSPSSSASAPAPSPSAPPPPSPSAAPLPPAPTLRAAHTSAVVRQVRLDAAPVAMATLIFPCPPTGPSPTGPGPLVPLGLSDPWAPLRRIVPAASRPVWPTLA